MKQWNLTNIYSSNRAFEEDLEKFKALLHKQTESLKERILNLQQAGVLFQELRSYVECRMAQETTDQDAHVKNGTLSELSAKNEAALFELGLDLAQLNQDEFEALLSDFSSISFFLTELRHLALKRASKDQEEVIHTLISDGYHSFWSLYQSFTGKMRIDHLSVGQAYNLLSDSDRSVRLDTFDKWTSAWKRDSDFLAQMLNHLAGFRLGVYRIRGWNSVLEEPLMMNRMEEDTLQSMWTAIEEAKPHFIRYLNKKAQILGLEKLSWVDVECPLDQAEHYTWDQACQIILSAFEKFHPRKAVFAKECFDKSWIDAEDRQGKAAGGFCLQFPKSKESRIFMTFKGTPINVATLAHELGHAYHNRCIEYLPFFHQHIKMNVAETASTFGEMVVIDSAISNAKTDREKRLLLDDKLQRSIAYFMNLQARLIFEKNFYEERKKGFVSADKLCSIMVDAQKEAYGDSLDSWDPYFWASKLHFYYTDYPFYNFPYTFGYLLSNSLYARAKEGGFGERFDAFLADTAQMTVEDLAQKHLAVDLKEPDFWRQSVGIIVQDIETFLNL